MDATPLGTAEAVPAASAVDHHHARRWLILAIIGIAQLMVVLDTTVVTIALPLAQKDLGFSNDSRQWIVTGYALAFGSLLLLGGRLADLFGRKITFLVGLAGFALASAVGGAANGFAMLVTARAAQGLFGALLAPAALSLLTTTFTNPKERGRAFGIYGAIAGAGGAVGLLLGGVLTQYLNWRWTLYVNLIFAVVAFVGALVLLRRQASGHRPPLDIPGTLLASAGLFCVVFGFSNAQTHSWGSPGTWGFLAGGALLLMAFVLVETRIAHPLLPMRVVLDRNRGGAYLTVFLIAIGMFAIFLFLTYFLQQNLGFTPVRTGFAFLPMVIVLMMAATTATARLLPRFGPRPLVAIGMAIAAAGMFWLTFLDTGSGYLANVLPPLLVAGLGLGLTMAPAMNAATDRVDPGDAGVASATVNVGQQIGGSIGTALLSSVATTATNNYLEGKLPNPATVAAGTVHGYVVTFGVTAALYLVGAVVCGLILRGGRTPAVDGAPVAMH